MLLRFYRLFLQLGIDPRKVIFSLRGFPRYLKDLWQFRASYDGQIVLNPCLSDWYEEGGTTTSEYFWQDLLVSRMIFAHNPQKHVDIGSRVDGFVAHVASFRELEVFDVRSITTHIPGVVFKQADLMSPLPDVTEYCDSLSCLHALEHFGLGRYGDPIDPQGFECGFANMASLLKDRGLFYLSVPIGVARVEFNANHVFDPRVIVALAEHNFLKVSELLVIRSGGTVERIIAEEETLTALAAETYALGIFVFCKTL
jgi:SAM-dependent methyltransferase